MDNLNDLDRSTKVVMVVFAIIIAGIAWLLYSPLIGQGQGGQGELLCRETSGYIDPEVDCLEHEEEDRDIDPPT